MKDRVIRLHNNLRLDTIGETDHTNEIIQDIYQITQFSISSYSNYHENIATVLKSFELYSDKSLPILLSIFQSTYSRVIQLPVEREMDFDILDIPFSKEIEENYRDLLKRNLSGKGGIRISDFELDTGLLKETDFKGLISSIINYLDHLATQIDWSGEQFEDILMQLAVLRGLCKKIDQLEFFYHSLNNFFDRLSLLEFPQSARHLCEEILITSFNDNVAYYGFFVCFKVYANAGNLHAGLLYGIFCVESLLKAKRLPTNKFLFELVWQSIKFYRTAQRPLLAIDVYKSIPKNMVVNAYERQSIELTYFTALLQVQDEELIERLENYLSQHRESILQYGSKACFPWLLLLHNLQRIAHDKFEGSGLPLYVDFFEKIVPPQMIAKQKGIVQGDSGLIKDYLKESLLKLKATLYKEDFVHDNEPAVKMAHRLIEDAVDKKDIEGLLLAMLVLSDFSMLFLEAGSGTVAPFEVKDVDISTFYDSYPDPVKSLHDFDMVIESALVLLYAPENKLFQMTYWNSNFQLEKIENWSNHEFDSWTKDIVPEIDFETSKQGRYNDTITFLYEDYVNQAEGIIKQIAFPGLNIPDNVSQILLVKDMELSELPHNLILDKGQNLIGLYASITNILSIEWLHMRLKNGVKATTADAAFWIPLDIADSTLNILFGKCEDLLKQFNVAISDKAKPSTPINSAINIIASHGSENISSTHVVYPNDDAVIFDLTKIVGNGKILIMLVCFSGSSQKDFYRNQVNSLVKQYLSRGYEAVIAPFWALNIDIPPIWLPAFFKSIQMGNQVSEAVFKANMAVYETYPTPSAWACMHLYGNPFFKIS